VAKVQIDVNGLFKDEELVDLFAAILAALAELGRAERTIKLIKAEPGPRQRMRAVLKIIFIDPQTKYEWERVVGLQSSLSGKHYRQDIQRDIISIIRRNLEERHTNLRGICEEWETITQVEAAR
jgi:hypothetical protein